MRVYVVSFGSIDRSISMLACQTLSSFLGLRTIDACVDARLEPVPAGALDGERGQHKTGAFLDVLASFARAPDPVIAVGIACVDLYSDTRPSLNFVFGEARVGTCCVVSLARLGPSFYGFSPNPSLLRERVVKEILHETGHVLGLGHCIDPLCVMRFSTSIHDTDLKHPRPCAACSARLQALIAARLGP